MKTNYNVTGAERKALVKVIATFLGEEPQYLGVPSCAYQIGDFTVSKDGVLEFSDRTDTETVEGLYEAIAAAGFTFEGEEEEPEVKEPAQTPETEPVSLTVSMPTAQHTGQSLRNLITLVYTRGELLNKALGTGFWVNPHLIDQLQVQALSYSVERVLKTITDFEASMGTSMKGLSVDAERITFSSLPETEDPEVIRTFTVLCGLMNKQALASSRIQARQSTEPNEKYAMRIWLTRLGMNGPDYKIERAVLMRNLSGHCAFHTPADQERWTRRQAEKREALKAAKAAATESEEAEAV